MKRIILKKLSLTHFKGIASLEADFNPSVAIVSGTNGAGKTTLFDAFTWVLFGKDSQGRKQFDIKTLDQQGVAIPKLPHEVTAVLDVDGAEITLTRRYAEKWIKKRGSAVEEFCGHEEERLYNHIPCNLKEWNEKITAICTEDAFRFITSPSCFSNQKQEIKRAMLMRMAGGVSDDEIANQDEEFGKLLDTLNGKSIEEYKKEIAAKKRLLKAEIDNIPARIDECNRFIEENGKQDFALCEAELKSKQEALRNVEDQFTSCVSQFNAQQEKQKAAYNNLNACRNRMLKIEADTRKELERNAATANAKRQKCATDIEFYKEQIQYHEGILNRKNDEIVHLKQEREKLIAEWKQINKITLDYGENAFICPTCGQHLDLDGVERKKAEMEKNFLKHKSELLEQNKKKGSACSMAVIQEREQSMKQIAEKLISLKEKLQQCQETLAQSSETIVTDEMVQQILEPHAIYKTLKTEEQELLQALESATIEAPDTSELREAKNMLTDSIAELKATLQSKTYLQKNKERVAELETSLRAQSEQLANLEGIEFTIAEFAKARIAAIEGKINSLFQIVKFKMYEQQINGGEVETCEAMVDGVPYASLNNAMRINAGLDIINAICRSEGICAPIFVDNAESILEPLATESQQIRMYVSDNQLTIN